MIFFYLICERSCALTNPIAWNFIEKEKPGFDLVVLCPPMIYGPLAHSIASIQDLNQSNKRIYDLFINSKHDAELPPNGLYLYVDVRVRSPFPILCTFNELVY